MFKSKHLISLCKFDFYTFTDYILSCNQALMCLLNNERRRKLSNNNRLGVSESAVVQRVNRKLKRDMRMLRKTRGARALVDFGDYYVVDYTHGGIVESQVDVEDLARELEVLKPWERVATEERGGRNQ